MTSGGERVLLHRLRLHPRRYHSPAGSECRRWLDPGAGVAAEASRKGSPVGSRSCCSGESRCRLPGIHAWGSCGRSTSGNPGRSLWKVLVLVLVHNRGMDGCSLIRAGRGRVREYFKCTWFHAASSAKGSCTPPPGPPSTIVADSRLSFFHLSPFAIRIVVVVVVFATQKGKSPNINFPQYLSNYSPSSSSCFSSCCWQTSIKKTSSSSSLPCILSSLPRGPTSATVDTSGRGASSFSSLFCSSFFK